jgi:RNA ligase
MSISKKYGRTFHYDFSPGTTSDDRINRKWREDIQKFETALHTEKMDGENTCLSPLGVFARSHATPTLHPWADHLKIKHSMMVNDLKENNLEIFGENLYAVHSIIYPRLEEHFYVFGVRIHDMWLSWEETKWYASMFDLPVAPELLIQPTSDTELIKSTVLDLSKQESVFGSLQNGTNPPIECTREGIVTRNINEYAVEDFAKNVFKFVRKDHVQTDVHWSKQITRARLIHEY